MVQQNILHNTNIFTANIAIHRPATHQTITVVKTEAIESEELVRRICERECGGFEEGV